nr:flagellar type III secretion system pore protein FliP [Jatrophihabitans sp. GAS493]
MRAPLRTLMRLLLLLIATVVAGIAVLTLGTGSASAATVPDSVSHAVVAGDRQAVQLAAPLAGPRAAPASPAAPAGPSSPTGPTTIDVGGNTKPSTSITILLLLTVISVAPSLLLMMTSFTKIFVVLSLTRNALGLQTVPPNQVLAGLSLFLSMFIMGPVLSKVNELGIQPYIHGTKNQQTAFHDGMVPLRVFMTAHTRPEEIALMLRAAKLPNPEKISDVGLTTLIPAFVLSELRSAMIIGFVIFIPFLVIDLVVSSSLMSLGMMMLPPVSVSLPFKLLLFVLVDGWGLIITALVQSYNSS